MRTVAFPMTSGHNQEPVQRASAPTNGRCRQSYRNPGKYRISIYQSFSSLLYALARLPGLDNSACVGHRASNGIIDSKRPGFPMKYAVAIRH